MELPIQFISYDLGLHGNVAFHFYYRAASFARPPDYGLIQ